MSARLMCPGCGAFRTPDEVDFAHTPVRCKECGTAIEVFDEQLEALDKQLAMAGRQPERMELYQRYPIYPPDDTQATDSDSQTSLTRILQVTLGDRETISRSTTSGSATYLCVMIFFAVVALLTELLSPHSGGVYFNPVIVCYLPFLVMLGGRSIGWLLVRPLASILHLIYPELVLKRVWIISTTVVSLSVNVLALSTLSQLPPLLQGVLLIIALIGAVIAGMMGEFMGTIARAGRQRKNWGVYSITGGSVTGSLLLVVFQMLGLIHWPGVGSFNGAGNVVEFCLWLAGASLVSMLFYALMWPLFLGASKLIRLGEEFHLSYVFVGGSLWAVIGYLAGTAMLTDADVVGSVACGAIVGLCGACGGWAIGEFRAGA